MQGCIKPRAAAEVQVTKAVAAFCVDVVSGVCAIVENRSAELNVR